MPPLPTFHRLPSAAGWRRVERSTGWCRCECSNTLSSTDFTGRGRRDVAPWTRRRSPRQAGCMAKTDKRRKTTRLPGQIDHAISAAEDKKAVDLVVLDLRKASGFPDFFVIASGTNTRQVRAIADAVMESLAAEGARPAHVEGYDRSEWILIDYFDFIVHVFAPEARAFYGLARLSGDAERTGLAASLRAGRRFCWDPRLPASSTRSPRSSLRRRAPPATNRSSIPRTALSAIAAGSRFCRSRRRSAIDAASRCRRGEPSAPRSPAAPAAAAPRARSIAPAPLAPTTARSAP